MRTACNRVKEYYVEHAYSAGGMVKTSHSSYRLKQRRAHFFIRKFSHLKMSIFNSILDQPMVIRPHAYSMAIHIVEITPRLRSQDSMRFLVASWAVERSSLAAETWSVVPHPHMPTMRCDRLCSVETSHML